MESITISILNILKISCFPFLGPLWPCGPWGKVCIYEPNCVLTLVNDANPARLSHGSGTHRSGGQGSEKDS